MVQNVLRGHINVFVSGKMVMQSLMQQQQQIAVLESRFHMLGYVYRRTGVGVAAVQKV